MNRTEPPSPVAPTRRAPGETLGFEVVEPARSSHAGTLAFLFDNDMFVGNDSRFTAGVAFAWTSADVETLGEGSFQSELIDFASFLPTVRDEGYRNFTQFTLGMEMYTPEDIEAPEPPPGDHPYAGVLYLDSSIFSRSAVSQHQFTLRLGLVGPSSGAAEMQRWIHEITGSPIPQGWDTQLGDEPLLNVYYQYSRRLSRGEFSRDFECDLAVNGGGGLGNYYTGANAGLLFRLGYRLPDNYGVTPMLGGAEPMVGLGPDDGTYVYGFFAAQVFGVARFLPIDGNTFTDSYSGIRDDWFGTGSAGIVFGWNRFLLIWTYHGISGLTDPEGIRADNQSDYGTLVLAWHFR